MLARGVPPREIISLEPLLREFDATELAAAALHVLERERAQRRAAEVNPVPPAKPRPSDGDRPRSDRPDRASPHARPEGGMRRPGSDRAPRGVPPRKNRDRS